MPNSAHKPPAGMPEPSPEDVRAQVEKILLYPEFADSERIQDFLRFIVEEKLSGRAEGLKGYTIGVEVFGRDESFDPHIDPIVRVDAGRLRRKLKLYYSEEGRNDAIHIEVRKGSYVPVYRVRPPPESPPSEGSAEGVRAADSTDPVPLETDAPGTTTQRIQSRGWRWAVATLVAILVLGGAAAWNFYLRSPEFEPASVEKMAFPLPKKPSIAVLPFINMSGDREQEYFSDGMTEDIITDLSKLPNLFVIARNSTFTYKGKPLKVQQVAEELGVRYVLEGSFQRAGERVRITAQLIDATTGRHIWAERYDREFKDVFALQDDITQKVVTAMEVKLTEGEQARITRRQTDNPEAYQLFRRGVERFRRYTKLDNAEARRLLKKAVSLDPNFGAGWSMLAFTHWIAPRFRWSANPAQDRARAEELAKKVLAIDDSNPDAYRVMAQIFLDKRQHEKAIAYGEKSVALAPNHAFNTAVLAMNLHYAGRQQEALELVKRANRLSPFTPSLFLRVLGNVYREMGEYDQAIAALERARAQQPNSPLSYYWLAMTYAEAGRMDEARAAAAELLKRNPKFSVKRFAKALPYKDPAELKRSLDALRKAGLPE